MFSDGRIADIEKKISDSLNEDAAPSKVQTIVYLISPLFTLRVTQKGGLGAVNMRVYAVKVRIICSVYTTVFFL